MHYHGTIRLPSKITNQKWPCNLLCTLRRHIRMPEPTAEAASPPQRQAPITAATAESRNCTLTLVNNLPTYTLCSGIEIIQRHTTIASSPSTIISHCRRLRRLNTYTLSKATENAGIKALLQAYFQKSLHWHLIPPSSHLP